MRTKIGIILIILFALFSNIWLLIENIGPYIKSMRDEDYVSFYEKRLEGLKKMLPLNSAVAYIADSNLPDGGSRLAQYVLSPIIIVKEITENQFIVGDFSNPIIDAADFKIFENINLILLKDFGDGVKLYLNQAK